MQEYINFIHVNLREHMYFIYYCFSFIVKQALEPRKISFTVDHFLKFSESEIHTKNCILCVSKLSLTEIVRIWKMTILWQPKVQIEFSRYVKLGKCYCYTAQRLHVLYLLVDLLTSKASVMPDDLNWPISRIVIIVNQALSIFSTSRLQCSNLPWLVG